MAFRFRFMIRHKKHKQTLNDCLGLNMLLPISFEYTAEQSGANIPYNCTPHTNSVWQ